MYNMKIYLDIPQIDYIEVDNIDELIEIIVKLNNINQEEEEEITEDIFLKIMEQIRNDAVEKSKRVPGFYQAVKNYYEN